MLIVLPGIAQAASPASVPAGVVVSFKLDPRVVDPTHGGQRWVSPSTYVGANAQDKVEALAQGIDAKGAPVKISSRWIPSDPEMVTVSPAEGNQVTIAVKKAGESKLKVVSQSVSQEFAVKAMHVGKFIQIAITRIETDEATAEPQVARKVQAAPVSKPLTEEALRALRQKDKEERKLAAQREEELVQKVKQQSEAFRAETGKKEGVVTLPSGLQYKVLKSGNGKKPADDDVVECLYRTTDVDGAEFDGSDGRGHSATIHVGAALPTWREALKLMPVGSKWQVFMPPQLVSNRGQGRRHRRQTSGPAVAFKPPLRVELDLLAIKDRAGPGEKTTATTALAGPKGN
jgi:FKBP-type peptidyl-prolyl cis-trans isomerase FklB